MGGGVDFDMANLIWRWRQKNLGEKGEKWFEHIDEILSEYEYKTIDFSDILQDKVLTSYVLVKKPTKREGSSKSQKNAKYKRGPDGEYPPQA